MGFVSVKATEALLALYGTADAPRDLIVSMCFPQCTGMTKRRVERNELDE